MREARIGGLTLGWVGREDGMGEGEAVEMILALGAKETFYAARDAAKSLIEDVLGWTWLTGLLDGW